MGSQVAWSSTDEGGRHHREASPRPVPGPRRTGVPRRGGALQTPGRAPPSPATLPAPAVDPGPRGGVVEEPGPRATARGLDARPRVAPEAPRYRRRRALRPAYTTAGPRPPTRKPKPPSEPNPRGTGRSGPRAAEAPGSGPRSGPGARVPRPRRWPHGPRAAAEEPTDEGRLARKSRTPQPAGDAR